MADRICEDLMDGKSLVDICRGDGLPNKATVLRWLRVHEDFRDQYARAREAQADTLFDDILSIADQYETTSDVADPDTIQRAKLRIDARKWMAGKLQPKKYGDKIDVEQRTTHEAGDSIAALMEAINGRTRSK